MAIFISDLHLSPTDSQTTLEFLKFLDSPIARSHTELYILGDLFARWIGDDTVTHYEIDIAHAISEYVGSNKNKTVYFMPGNRDFLIGEKFLKLSQMTLLSDPCIIEINHQKILLTHGDQLCTEDTHYQTYRKIAQSRLGRQLFLKLPRWIRQKIANYLQRKPENLKSDLDSKPRLLKDPVTPSGLDNMIKNQCFTGQVIIHGHTHIPSETTDQGIARIVLGDWQNYPGYYYVTSIET
jgi:UDP-2,3-diacylglucosamine hydrolase